MDRAWQALEYKERHTSGNWHYSVLQLTAEFPDASSAQLARKVPARPLQQVFVHDPDGVMIELNFWNEADVPEIDRSASMPGDRIKPGTAAKKKAPAARKLVGAK